MNRIRHTTAGMFLLRWPATEARWVLELVRRPGEARWALPGGHVKPDENPAQAVLRAVRDETGYSAVLVAPPHQVPVPAGFGIGRQKAIQLPWWIVQEPVAGDRQPGPHIHVDFLYVGLIDVGCPVTRAGPRPLFRWVAADDLPGLDLTDGTRLLAADILDRATAGRLVPRPARSGRRDEPDPGRRPAPRP
ncbi:NUDIX domain-containing protein [Pseudofrankia sp. DC12]|uniref:NUDIX domain-containing protein n=1 Tax=Pseudofrankia sp. DC12 TaxID=683315 RepID=UPI000A51EF05|nr:NUDIX domain-containing protein [Pseudofrankia sp. DC12]